MIDYYFKFLSEEEAFQVFKNAGYTSQNEEGQEFVISATHSYSIDLIGDIYEGGMWEPNENDEIIMIEEPVKIDGYHVNMRILSGDIDETLRPYIIDRPITPYRVFA